MSMDPLSMLFEENGDLKDEFRRFPEPKDPDPELQERRTTAWQAANLDRIPDWEKVAEALRVQSSPSK